MLSLDPYIIDFLKDNFLFLMLIKAALNQAARISNNNTTNLVSDWFNGMMDAVRPMLKNRNMKKRGVENAKSSAVFNNALDGNDNDRMRKHDQ